jgi:hypothetical protein
MGLRLKRKLDAPALGRTVVQLLALFSARSRIDDCPIAKTSRVDCQNFPAWLPNLPGYLWKNIRLTSANRSCQNFAVGWGKARAGVTWASVQALRTE